MYASGRFLVWLSDAETLQQDESQGMNKWMKETASTKVKPDINTLVSCGQNLLYMDSP